MFAFVRENKLLRNQHDSIEAEHPEWDPTLRQVRAEDGSKRALTGLVRRSMIFLRYP